MKDKWKDRTEFYIRPTTVAAREKLVHYLETIGYTFGTIMDRDDVISSFLPVVADTSKKEIRRMGNVTVAACAAQCKVLLTENEFYRLFAQKFAEHG